MYTTEQVRGLLRQQKEICANILVDKHKSGGATMGDMWDAPEPNLTPDGIRPPLPENCIISPHFDSQGFLDGGYIVKNGIIQGHIDPRGATGAIGPTGATGMS